MPVQTGQPAPAFRLHDTTKQEVSLDTLRGDNLVLLFFPLAFTSVCTKELCGVRDNLDIYNTASAKVFGISVDSPQVLARFKAEQGLNFELLSDFNKEASADYGVLYEQFGWMKGVSKRAAFVIDRQGIIRYAEVLENAGDLPDFEAIQAALQQLS